MKKITEKQRITRDKHQGIVALYKTGQYTTEQIAINYNVTVRQVQRIASKYGVIRTIAESNKLMAPLKHYHTIPLELRRKQRKYISNKRRFEIIAAHPYCNNCGMRPADGIRLEVDHIDEDATNNEATNLQVLCGACNTGKSHAVRFGSTTVNRYFTTLGF